MPIAVFSPALEESAILYICPPFKLENDSVEPTWYGPDKKLPLVSLYFILKIKSVLYFFVLLKFINKFYIELIFLVSCKILEYLFVISSLN